MTEEEKCTLDYSKERVWERGFLMKKCEEVGVEEEFILYERRLRVNALGVFLLLHSVWTILHSILLLTITQNPEQNYVDVYLYVGAAIFIIIVMSINFKEDIISKHSWIMYLTSVIAVHTLIAVDVAIHLYHHHDHFWVVGSFYDTYLLNIIYLFLPIPSIKGPLILGCWTSAIYVLFSIYFLRTTDRIEAKDIQNFNHVLVDFLHYGTYNMLGVFFRIISDIIVRSSFLDRQQYVMEDIWLGNARKQETLLLHSILPPQIAKPLQDDIQSRIALAGKRREFRIHIKERIMAIQIHPEVSILYADVVNYTHLTTKLTVQELVTLLHDIYARFDVAASNLKVQRIKFLGDCYYCVSGLIRPDPAHANCCVDLGHSMISQIRDVRTKRNVDIDMRIGVHSGYVFAGVIGAAKLQYDVWGEDVQIANKLESTGRPGHIHISERTLRMMLDHSYEIQPGPQLARDDPFLQKRNILTYLITGMEIGEIKYDLEQYESFAIIRVPSKLVIIDQNNRAKIELRNEFEKMPVGALRIKDYFGKQKEDTDHNRPLIEFAFLHFRDLRLEYNYMRQPDYMLKYSVLFSWWICVVLIYIRVVDYYSSNEMQYTLDLTAFLIMTVFVLITWYKKFCFWRYSKKKHKYNIVSCQLFRLAEMMQRVLICRICIYMITIMLYFLVIAEMLMNCDKEEYEVLHIESKLYLYEGEINMCYHPWVLTNMVCLIIGISIIYRGIPFMMKIVVSILEAIIYVIIIFFQFEYLTGTSLTTNPNFLAEYAHALRITMSLVCLYHMERQAEFNNKVNYKWRIDLLKKQHDAHITNKSISILLNNILPVHVVNLYLTSLEKHELYYENYELVSVMFASLKNFQTDMPNLRVLNEIISEFDKILSHYKSDYLVEKIKIVNCTYMAACGLDIRYSALINEPEVSHTQHFRPTRTKDMAHNEEVVFVLTTFALDLMRTLWLCNNVYKAIPVDRVLFIGDMSVGISSGEVMAGVVGASQVHYDIWGNAVNMASRMDSTGLVGHIQVTEETAMILLKYGLQCDYRGQTYVKGRGILPTYFVAITEDYEFIYIPDDSHKQVRIMTAPSMKSDSEEDKP